MAWARLDDDFFSHPKVTEILEDSDGWAAIGFWTVCLSWAHRHTRKPGKVPGFIPRSAVTQMDRQRGLELAGKLVLCGLWELAENGWNIHDFDKYLPSAAMSKSRAEAGRKGGLAKAAKLASSQDSLATARTPPGEIDPKNVASSQENVTSSQKALARAKQTPSKDTGTGIGSSKELQVVDGSVSKAPAAKTRGSRLPDDFTVTAEMVQWARANCPHVDGKYETEKFCDYWRAKAGAAGTKTDWTGTWRNWLRRAEEDFLNKNGAKGSTTDSRVMAALELPIPGADGEERV
jgi:hypothetical protein